MYSVGPWAGCRRVAACQWDSARVAVARWCRWRLPPTAARQLHSRNRDCRAQTLDPSPSRGSSWPSPSPSPSRDPCWRALRCSPARADDSRRGLRWWPAGRAGGASTKLKSSSCCRGPGPAGLRVGGRRPRGRPEPHARRRESARGQTRQRPAQYPTQTHGRTAR
jgi:hypothetical protein